MEYLVGISLALVVSLWATLVGLDKDRAFYPTVLLVIASYYNLFAVIGGSTEALIVESLVMAIFVCATVLGFKRNLWIVVVALFAHGVLDFFHGQLIVNPGVPVWWPMFCLSYDLVAATYLAWLLTRSNRKEGTE